MADSKANQDLSNSGLAATAHSFLSEEQRREFENILRAMSLQQLMELRRESEREVEELHRTLALVRSGDRSVLKPYYDDDHNFIRVRDDDVQKEREIIREKHLRDEKTVGPIRNGQDPAVALEHAKKWLQEMFPSVKTESFIVKDDNGASYIATVGISGDEVTAAIKLQQQQRKARESSALLSARIAERIESELQKPAPSPAEHEINAPAIRAMAPPEVRTINR